MNFYNNETYSAVAEYLGFEQKEDDWWWVENKWVKHANFVTKDCYVLKAFNKIKEIKTHSEITDECRVKGGLLMDRFEIGPRVVFVSLYYYSASEDCWNRLLTEKGSADNLRLFPDDYKDTKDMLYQIVAYVALAAKRVKSL